MYTTKYSIVDNIWVKVRDASLILLLILDSDQVIFNTLIFII